MTPTDFPTIFANISDRYAQNLEQALREVDGYKAEGVLIKAEFEVVKSYISSAVDAAWKKVIGDGYRWGGKQAQLSEKEHDLAWRLGHPYPHLIPGYLKRAKAFKGESAMRDAMVALLEEMLPLSLALDSLKPLIGKRAPKVTKTSLERAERDAKAMTCQCCARKILAETGAIAHHGYERPGSGWQTASCQGAKELPLEVSREALGRMLTSFKAVLAASVSARAKTEAETTPLSYRWLDQTQKVNRWDKAIERFITVTRETFDAEYAQIKDKCAPTHVQPTFDQVKARALYALDQDISMWKSEIAYHQPRYDDWVQTHDRVDGAWVSVKAA